MQCLVHCASSVVRSCLERCGGPLLLRKPVHFLVTLTSSYFSIEAAPPPSSSSSYYHRHGRPRQRQRHISSLCAVCKAFMVSRITTRGGGIIPHSAVPLMFEEEEGEGHSSSLCVGSSSECSSSSSCNFGSCSSSNLISSSLCCPKFLKRIRD